MSEGSVAAARPFTIRRAGLQRPARARVRRCRAENITMTSKPRGCVADRVERWSVSPEVDGQALSLASQLPQVPISNKQPCAGKAACGSGLACDSGGKALTCGDSSNAGLSALKWMNRPYRWQASSHRYPLSRQPHAGKAACGRFYGFCQCQCGPWRAQSRHWGRSYTRSTTAAWQAIAVPVCGLARDSGGKALTRGDSSNAGLSILKWMNRPYRWQASSHRYSIPSRQSHGGKTVCGSGLARD